MHMSGCGTKREVGKVGFAAVAKGGGSCYHRSRPETTLERVVVLKGGGFCNLIMAIMMMRKCGDRVVGHR